MNYFPLHQKYIIGVLLVLLLVNKELILLSPQIVFIFIKFQ